MRVLTIGPYPSIDFLARVCNRGMWKPHRVCVEELAELVFNPLHTILRLSTLEWNGLSRPGVQLSLARLSSFYVTGDASKPQCASLHASCVLWAIRWSTVRVMATSIPGIPVYFLDIDAKYEAP